MRNEVRIKVGKIFKKIDKLARSGKDYQIEYKKYVDELVNKGDFEYLQLTIETHYGLSPFLFDNVSHLKSASWDSILEQTSSSQVERIKLLYKTKKVYQQGINIMSEDVSYATLTLSDTMDSNYQTISGTTSKIGFTKDLDSLNIDIIDDHLFNITISSVNWSDTIPTRFSSIDNIRAVSSAQNDYFTQSSYKTNIKLEYGGVYHIEVEKKNDYGKFFYRLDVTRDDLIGTIKEVNIDDYLESNYYYKNKKMAEILGYKKTFLEVKKPSDVDVTSIVYNDDSLSEEMNLYQRYVMAIDYLLS